MRLHLNAIALALFFSPLHGQQACAPGMADAGEAALTRLSLPDDPSSFAAIGLQPSSQAGQQAAARPEQTRRILGIVPNFRSVGADTILSPQTAKEKLTVGLQDSFDYSSFVFAGLQAGESQASKSYPAFRQGAAGYGRYYWHTFVDQTDENLWVESLLPMALHEDSRYYTLGRGSFLKRARYALSRSVITRNDTGGETFNVAEVVGAGAAAGISSAYYPGKYRTWTKTGQRWLTNLILDSTTLVAKEFWPDINHSIIHRGD